MLVCEVHSSLVRIGAYLIAVFYKTMILEHSQQLVSRPRLEPLQIYRLLALCSPYFIQRVMVLTNMKSQEMFRWKVLSTIRTTICMHFPIVNFELLEGRECQGLFMGWKRAFHYCFCRRLFRCLDVLGGMRGSTG